MSCPLESRDHTELLTAYAGRKLDAEKAGLVEKHMEHCGACRDWVLEQQTLWDALDNWEAAPVSSDFNRRLYQRIDEQGTWRARLLNPWRLIFQKGVPLAAGAALVLVAAVMLDRTGAPPPWPAESSSQLAVVQPLQPEQVVEALDEMQELSQFNDLMKPENLKSKM